MPGIDDYPAEVARALGVRGRLRRRVCADLRGRLAAAAAEEREHGLSEAEAEARAIERLGAPATLAGEYRERVLTVRVTVAAQEVLAGFVVVAVGLAAIVWRVIEARNHRSDGEVTVTLSGGWKTTADLYHHYPGLGLWLPSGIFAQKIVVAALFMVAALVAAEIAIELAPRRRSVALALASLGGLMLMAAGAAQIAFGIEWRQTHMGHGVLLAAILATEVVAVVAVLVLLGRLVSSGLPAPIRALGQSWTSVLVSATPLAAVAIWYGFGVPNSCSWSDACQYLPADFLLANHFATMVDLPQGPTEATGALALRGRTLAVALTVNRRQPPPESFEPPSGALELAVWQTSWPAALQGPCGRADRNNPSLDPLAPDRRDACDIRDSASHPGVRWRRLANLALRKPAPLALTYLDDGRLALAYYRDGAVWKATAPAWKPERLFSGGVDAIRIAPAGGHAFVLAALSGQGASRQLELAREGDSRASRVPRLWVSGKGLDLVSSGRQIGLLYRDESKHLVFELRTPGLRLLERRELGRWTQGVLGKLPGGRIAIATLTSLERYEKRLTILVARRGRLSVDVSERLGKENEIYCDRLEGVVQTGRTIRVLGRCGGRISLRAAPVISDNAAFALSGIVADWPRYASLGEGEAGGLGARSWRMFELTLWQSPERQLLDENGSG